MVTALRERAGQNNQQQGGSVHSDMLFPISEDSLKGHSAKGSLHALGNRTRNADPCQTMLSASGRAWCHAAAKAIELEDIHARLSELERAARASREMKKS
jgi:hypothetical protein